MRTLALSTAVALLLAGSPALVQAQDSPTPPKAQTQPQPQQDVTIRSIQVVDVDELQAGVRSKVDALIANTKQQKIQSLRKSIDATPEAVSALKAKGRSSAQVVAINLDENGTLTIFTKKGA
ncbi:MAG: hypothetical protein GEU95_24075 [Rhizobiales bacterium]|nr:hypothetical protein [Hyphomicrobiales bacterium]